jgi:hypothetical protein
MEDKSSQDLHQQALALPWTQRLHLAQVLLESLHEGPTSRESHRAQGATPPPLPGDPDDDWPHTGIEDSLVSVTATSHRISIPHPPEVLSPEQTTVDDSADIAQSFQKLRQALESKTDRAKD